MTTKDNIISLSSKKNKKRKKISFGDFPKKDVKEKTTPEEIELNELGEVIFKSKPTLSVYGPWAFRFFKAMVIFFLIVLVLVSVFK